MRAPILVLALGLALWSIPVAAAGEDGDCARGPYEMVLPANVNCCGWSEGPFCLWDCTVWVNNPLDIGPDVCTSVETIQ